MRRSYSGGIIVVQVTHILGRATDGLCALAKSQPFAQAKVDEFDVIIGVQQDILRLQVTVNYSGVLQEIYEEKIKTLALLFCDLNSNLVSPKATAISAM